MNNNTERSTEKKEHLALFPFQLVDVRIFEIVARRCNPEDEEVSPKEATIKMHKGEEEIDSEEFGILLTFETSIPAGEKPICNLYLAIEGRFQSIIDIGTIKPEIIEKFKNVDALVLFWPYLRQILHDITTRMRLSVPPLPIIDPITLIQTDEENREQNN